MIKPKYVTLIKFSKTNLYGCGRQDEDDVYTIDEWVEHVNEGSFVDYDGYGYFVKDSLADDQMIKPSMVKSGEFKPYDATHIVWYNR